MTRDRRTRRAIRPMSLNLEDLEARKLLAVNAQALLSPEVDMYWNYTNGLYGSSPGSNGTNASGTTSNSSTVNGITDTVTTTYNNTYTVSTTGSSGNMTTTWSVYNASTTTTTISGTYTSADPYGYRAHPGRRDRHEDRLDRLRLVRPLRLVGHLQQPRLDQ